VASTEGAGGYEVDHKQVVPQAMLGQLAPGVAVVAAVDPSDRERVELNWAQGVHTRGQLDVPWVDAAIVAEVTILAVEDLGPVGQFTQMELRLKVTPQSGLPAFELPYKLVASDRIKALAVTGATFDADYDPANPTDVDIHMPPPAD
jgi:hypothetical protein